MRTIFFLAALLTAGCGSEAVLDATIVSRVTPSYAPQRSDAIAIVVPDKASAQDRALSAALADELARGGFKLVDKSESARWILQSGYVVAAPAAIAPDSESGEAARPVVDARNADIRLSLYSVTEYINGDAVAIWTSTAYDVSEPARQHPQTLLRLLLKNFGGDFDGSPRANDPDAASARSR